MSAVDSLLSLMNETKECRNIIVFSENRGVLFIYGLTGDTVGTPDYIAGVAS